MAPTDIVPSVADSVTIKADSYDKLAGYEAFRRIKDDFAEPPRPSLDDVEGVAGVIAAAAAFTLSQDSFAAAGVVPASKRIVTQLHPVEGVKEGPGAVVRSRCVEALGPVAMAGMQTNEGFTFRLRLSPGVIRRRKFDANRKERSEERRRERATKAATIAGAEPVPAGAGAEVKEWSAKSRVRLIETVASLDYSEWTRDKNPDTALAMVTLTLPDRWLEVAPDGATFKNHVRKFQKRWVRAGLPWRCLWKLEFQGRGAPHWHGLLRVPVFVNGRIFTEWLSETWADVVGASTVKDRYNKKLDEFTSEYDRHLRGGTGVDFSGKDFSDPRRISMYFLGHSTKSRDGKEYQHNVPEEWQVKGKGPGRFWGYAGLRKAVVEIDLTEKDSFAVDRVLRKVKRARDWKVNVLRVQGTAKREGLAVPRAFEIEVPGRKRAGRAAHRTANLRAFAASQADSNLGKPLEVAWAYRSRSAYRPFSGGQGGFVLVNDALELGLGVARVLEGTKKPLEGLASPGVLPLDLRVRRLTARSQHILVQRAAARAGIASV